MAVEIERLEPGIYRTRLSGDIALEELIASQVEGRAQAAANGDQAYVLIIDIDRTTRMPFDLRHAGQIVEKNDALAVLSVGASFHIRLIVNLLGRLFQLGRVEHHSTLMDAVQRARALLS